MEDQLKLGIVQYDIVWEDPIANQRKVELMMERSEEVFDLIVLPEMFTTGFSMNTSDIAEKMGGLTEAWMVGMAVKYKTTFCGSVIIEENENYYNRLLWVNAEGLIAQYDKRHLFTLAKEDRYFTEGREKLIVELSAKSGVVWRICPLICYDLRFPVWSRNVENYDVLIYVANFPDKRQYAWHQLLIARAIENQCYTIGVNRIGTDGIGIPYAGGSMLVGYDGQIIENAGAKEGVFKVMIEKKSQDIYRRAYNFLADKDDFELKI